MELSTLEKGIVHFRKGKILDVELFYDVVLHLLIGDLRHPLHLNHPHLSICQNLSSTNDAENKSSRLLKQQIHGMTTTRARG